jgi:hypothetical protein
VPLVRQKDSLSTKAILSNQDSWNLDYLVWPNICDVKRGFATYLCKKPPEIRDDKRYPMLNIAELLPDMCDNHQSFSVNIWPCTTNIWLFHKYSAGKIGADILSSLLTLLRRKP